MEEETADKGKVKTMQDHANGIALARFTVTPRNVEDLHHSQTAKAGTAYVIMPGKQCVMKEATWGLTQRLDEFIASVEENLDHINDPASPWHWMRVNIKKASMLTDPVDFTWTEITLEMDGAEHLSVPVLQRISSDFRYATNGSR